MKSKSLDISTVVTELSLLLKGTTYTFGTAQSCNFKKLKVYKTKISYIIFASFFDLNYVNATYKNKNPYTQICQPA